MGRDSESMRSIFLLSIKEIEETLNGKKKISDNTRLAAATLLSYSKIKTADIQEKALEIGIRGAGRQLKAIDGKAS